MVVNEGVLSIYLKNGVRLRKDPFDMAEKKSVHFSSILEETLNGSSTASSEVDAISFTLGGMDFEEVHIASLSRSAQKYRVPAADTDEQRTRPRRRKVSLLTFGFIFLLGIGGLSIYFITRQLSNRERNSNSKKVGDKETGVLAENTVLQGNFSLSPQATRIRNSSWRGKCYSLLSCPIQINELN